MSATACGCQCARASWACGGSLGLAQAGSKGGKSGRARGKGRRGWWAAGCGCTAAELGWAKAGPKITRRKISFFFFFLQYFKAFSNYILNSLLNLIQSTQYKILNALA
jgi:hypothetical protein